MEAPLYLLYLSNTKITHIDVSHPLSIRCKYPIAYANAVLNNLPGLQILQQSFGTYLCFMEQYELSCDEPFKISFQVKDHTFFLFFMLEGQVGFTGPDGLLIASPQSGWCYATFNSPEVYEAAFPTGKHEFLYIAIHPNWLESLSRELPALQPFIYSFLSGRTVYGVLPPYLINSPLRIQLKRLFEIKTSTITELEGLVQLSLTRILITYHEILQKNRSQDNELAYRALDYLNKHYRESNLSNVVIAQVLYTTTKTLIDSFHTEFRITPRSYIIHLRMRLGYDLLQQGNTTTQEVYSQVGYRDAHSFRVQFKRYYGYPPRDLH